MELRQASATTGEDSGLDSGRQKDVERLSAEDSGNAAGAAVGDCILPEAADNVSSQTAKDFRAQRLRQLQQLLYW